MNDRLKRELAAVEELANADRCSEALNRMEKLIGEYPEEPSVWAKRGYVNSRCGDREAAIQDLSRSIELFAREPHPFYTRGILLFQVGKYREAVDDFSVVLGLCDEHGSDYYREPAHLFRAECYVRLKQYDNARAECKYISDEMRTWTDKLRSKADILAECCIGDVDRPGMD